MIQPGFQREQERIEALRSELFGRFAAGAIGKDVVEDTCRKEAVASFRKLIAERRMQVPPQAGRQLIGQAVATINDLFEEMYSNKAADFARLAAARQLFCGPGGTFPHGVQGEHGQEQRLSELEPRDGGFERGKPKDLRWGGPRVTEKWKNRTGFKDQLKAVYWGGVTQYLADLHYGPEGLVRGGDYISRDGLPASGRQFERYLDEKAPELFSDPVQVANRLRATFAYFEYNVSPYYSLPWPNLYRNNDLLRSSGKPNEVRDPKTVKPREPAVDLCGGAGWPVHSHDRSESARAFAPSSGRARASAGACQRAGAEHLLTCPRARRGLCSPQRCGWGWRCAAMRKWAPFH